MCVYVRICVYISVYKYTHMFIVYLYMYTHMIE